MDSKAAARAKYRASEKYKETRKRLRSQEKHKQKALEYQKGEKFKALAKRWRDKHSVALREKWSAYSKSEKGKRVRRYNNAPWNLQYLTPKENRTKTNKYE